MPNRPLSVLVVDDEQDYAKSLGLALKYYLPGLTTTPAFTGRAGLARVKDAAAGKIDLILLDLFLPCGKGEIVLEWFLAAAPDVPIIIITGAAGADPDLEAALVRMGAESVVSKTMPLDDLARAIFLTVERHRMKTQTRNDTREGAREVKEVVQAARGKTERLGDLAAGRQGNGGRGA